MHCRGAAITVRRLLFMIRRSFTDLPKAALIPLYCAVVRPHLEFSMEANPLNLMPGINHLERAQRSATPPRAIRGNASQTQPLLAGTQTPDLILEFKIFKDERVHLKQASRAVFDELVARFLYVWRLLLACYPQCRFLRSSWTINCSTASSCSFVLTVTLD